MLSATRSKQSFVFLGLKKYVMILRRLHDIPFCLNFYADPHAKLYQMLLISQERQLLSRGHH